jgi:hypothetical protein
VSVCPYCGASLAGILDFPSRFVAAIRFVRCPACFRSSLLGFGEYPASSRLGPAEAFEVVTLSEADAGRVAAHVERVLAAVAREGFGDRFTPGESDRALKLRTYGAELAVSVYTGLPWNAVVLDRSYRGAKPADVGQTIEVRTTGDPAGPLYVYRGDVDGRIAILARGGIPRYELLGWIATAEAKALHPWTDRGLRLAAFVVPQADLRPFPIPSELLR